MTRKLCPLCKKNEEDGNCTIILDWKSGKENRGGIRICMECFDNLQQRKRKMWF